MWTKLTFLALLALPLAGCASLVPAAAPGDGPAAPLAFAQPVLLTTEGPGFEPSIDVAPDGTVYVTAARAARTDGSRLASWLWHSQDAGASWADLPSPMGIHKLFFGFEGDTAVDAKGRLYFVDTYLPDNTVSRWSPGPTWDFSRPVQGTVPALDDRPWLTAHGDGVVYLMSNNAVDAPARMWLSISEDGGLTWTRGHGFPGGRFCHPAASPADDRTVLVACSMGEGKGSGLVVHVSRDRGATWAEAWRTTMEVGSGYLTPVAAFDAAGAAYVAWLDERVDWSRVQDVAWAGETPGRVMLARSPDGEAWDSFDATPFAGRFGMIHLSAGRAGTVAVTFHATEDLTPDEETAWHGVALVSASADAAAPSWSHARLDPAPTGRGEIPPRDFFQGAIGPDNALHVALQRNREDGARAPGDGIHADVLHVRQVAGPNLPS